MELTMGSVLRCNDEEISRICHVVKDQVEDHEMLGSEEVEKEVKHLIVSHVLPQERRSRQIHKYVEEFRHVVVSAVQRVIVNHSGSDLLLLLKCQNASSTGRGQHEMARRVTEAVTSQLSSAATSLLRAEDIATFRDRIIRLHLNHLHSTFKQITGPTCSVM